MFVLKNTPKYPAGQRRNSKGIGKYLEMKIKLKYNIAKLMVCKQSFGGNLQLACIKKEKSHISNLIFHIKKLEKEEHINSKTSKRK